MKLVYSSLVFSLILVLPRSVRKSLLVSPPEPTVKVPPIRPQDIEVAVCGAEKMAATREEINQRVSRSGRFTVQITDSNLFRAFSELINNFACLTQYFKGSIYFKVFSSLAATDKDNQPSSRNQIFRLLPYPPQPQPRPQPQP